MNNLRKLFNEIEHGVLYIGGWFESRITFLDNDYEIFMSIDGKSARSLRLNDVPLHFS
jgi:hypothetical protein